MSDVEESAKNEEVGGGRDGGHSHGHGQKGKSKRIRPRKRKIYSEIKELMEFYLGDSNIRKSKMIKELLDKSEAIPLTVFLTFNKLKTFTTDIEVLRKAILKSDLLELCDENGGGDGEEKRFVKRKIKYDPNKDVGKDNLEDCTVYVENVPSNANHDWLKSIFQAFGPVSYISLPKFKYNNKPKGFAFIEYSNIEAAQECLKQYGEIGATLSTNIDPSSLVSIKTFVADPEKPKDEENVSKKDLNRGVKRGVDELSTNNNETEDSPEFKKPKISDKKDEKEIVQNNEKGNESADLDQQTISKKSKRRRNKNKLNMADDDESKLEADSIQLKVLPKKTWRQLRNRYLNLQREHMSQLKKELREQKLNQNQNNGHDEPPKKSKQQDSIIVRLEMPIGSPRTFEWLKLQFGPEFQDIETQFIIKFIDYLDGNDVAFIRIDNSMPQYKPMQTVLFQNLQNVFQNDGFRLLNDMESEGYFNGVKRKFKVKKNVEKKKIRGRDRLLALAIRTPSSRHTRFDGDDADAHDEDKKVEKE